MTHTAPRCQKCKFCTASDGILFRCSLLQDKDDEQARVETITTTFKRYENCAYRIWHECGLPSVDDLKAICKQARAERIYLA